MKWLLRFLMALCLLFTGGYAYMSNHSGFQHGHHSAFHLSKRTLHGGFRAVQDRQLLTIQKAHNSPDDEHCSLELNSNENEDEDERLLSLAAAALALNTDYFSPANWPQGTNHSRLTAYSRPIQCCTSPKFIVYRNIRI